MNDNPFLQLLQRGEGVGFQTDDVLAAVLPLFRQVAAWHEQSLVAPLHSLATVAVDESGALRCDGTAIARAANLARIEELQKPVASALNVIGHARVTSDDEAGTKYANLEVTDGEAELKHPAYVTGYRTWEELIGHHDAFTDIFALGLILASLALGLDFTDADDLGIFVSHRANLFGVNARLHPVLAAVIVEMTELNRHRRAPDLPSLIRRLENYREQTPEIDVAKLPGFAEAGLNGRRKLVQTHLRDRLFEISRRNRLLYFKASQASLNFTVASVPMVMNLASVRLEQLFVWHPALAAEVIDGKPMSLGRWLRFEDQPYLPSALDKLVSDARRDRAEYGFAQLRLVIAFLHWHNLKEAPQERIVSPLLLLPVELTKKKGVRDQYLLDPTSSEAEVNPALRHHLHQLYGLRLPEVRRPARDAAGAVSPRTRSADSRERTRCHATTRGQAGDPAHPRARPPAACAVPAQTKAPRAGEAHQSELQLQLRPRELPAARFAALPGKGAADSAAAAGRGGWIAGSAPAPHGRARVAV